MKKSIISIFFFCFAFINIAQDNLITQGESYMIGLTSGCYEVCSNEYKKEDKFTTSNTKLQQQTYSNNHLFFLGPAGCIEWN